MIVLTSIPDRRKPRPAIRVVSLCLLGAFAAGEASAARHEPIGPTVAVTASELNPSCLDTGPCLGALLARPDPTSAGYQVAQSGALKFLRNIPTPRIRPPKRFPVPDFAAALRALPKLPAPKLVTTAQLAALKLRLAAIPRSLKSLPSPSFARLARRGPDSSELPPPGRISRQIDEPVPDIADAAAKPTKLGPKHYMKDAAVFVGLVALGVVPGVIVDKIYPVEGAIPAERISEDP